MRCFESTSGLETTGEDQAGQGCGEGFGPTRGWPDYLAVVRRYGGAPGLPGIWRDFGLQPATLQTMNRRCGKMTEPTRRDFFRLAILGLVTAAWAARGFDGDLAPTPADPAVPEGATVEITLRNGRTVCRICRGGYWITAVPAA